MCTSCGRNKFVADASSDSPICVYLETSIITEKTFHISVHSHENKTTFFALKNCYSELKSQIRVSKTKTQLLPSVLIFSLSLQAQMRRRLSAFAPGTAMQYRPQPPLSTAHG